MSYLWSPLLDVLCEVSDEISALETRIWKLMNQNKLSKTKAESFKLKLEILSSRASVLRGVDKLRVDSRIRNINSEMDAYFQRLGSPVSAESPTGEDVVY